MRGGPCEFVGLLAMVMDLWVAGGGRFSRSGCWVVSGGGGGGGCCYCKSVKEKKGER